LKARSAHQAGGLQLFWGVSIMIPDTDMEIL
jgi:hypothetical protein